MFKSLFTIKNSVSFLNLCCGLQLRATTLGKNALLLGGLALIIWQSRRDGVIPIIGLHVFKVLRFLNVWLTVLDNTPAHVRIATWHAWDVLGIALWCAVWVGEVLKAVMSALRKSIRVCTDHAAVIHVSSGMMMLMEVFVLILHDHFLKYLMRIVLICLSLMNLFTCWLLGSGSSDLSNLGELALHLTVSHTV